MVKVTDIIIGLIIMSLTIVLIIPFISQGIIDYNITSSDASELAAYNKLDSVYNKTQEIKNASNINRTTDSPFDTFLSGGISTISLSLTSFETITDISTLAVNQSSGLLGDNAGIIAKGLLTIVLISLIAVLIRSIIKVDW